MFKLSASLIEVKELAGRTANVVDIDQTALIEQSDQGLQCLHIAALLHLQI